MSDYGIKTLYIVCNDFGHDGINIIGVYDDITSAKQAAVADHIHNTLGLHKVMTADYVMFECKVNGKVGPEDAIDFVVDADAIVAYGPLYV